ncbi:hypothetical protein BOX15_Mlig024422g1, partial [Macrostomum lignano]
ELSDALAQDCSSGLSAAGASGNNGAVASLANSGGGSGDGASSSSSQPGSTVIVNYLPSSIGNNELKKLFESVGPTTNSIVVRDRITKESKCFGFVSYESPNDAERAVEVLNGRLIQDKCIRVGIAIPQQELGHTGKLYVAGFPAYWNDNELMAAFKPYGRILSSRVLIDPSTGLSKCSGFVNFESYHCAEEAAKELQGKEFDKHVIKIQLHKPGGGEGMGAGQSVGLGASSGQSSGQGGHAEENPADCNLMVNFLPAAFTDEDLRDLFETIGQLRSSKIVRTPEGESKCFGFVTYVAPQDAAKASIELTGRLIQGKKLKVQFAKPEIAENGKLYIGNLPEGYAQSDLDKLFDSYGPLKESKLLMDKRTGKSKGCGFIELCSGPLADMAIAQLNGLQLDGAPQPLKVHRPLPPKGALLLGGQVGAAGVSPVNQLTVKHELLPAHIRPFGVAAGLHPTDGLLSPPNKKRRTDTAEEALTAAVAAHQQQPKQDKGEFPLFVYGLGDAAQDIDLWELFGPHGAVKSVKVIRDAATQKPRGYGFVTMLRYSEAVEAVKKVNGHLLGEKRLQVRFK